MYPLVYTQTNPPLLIPDVPMTAAERIELGECESTIQAHITAYVEVGTALMIIREKRLYRELYPTFEEYTRERWQINSRQLAAQNILAAQIANRLSNIIDTSKLKITHALELAKLEGVTDSELASIYTLIQQTAPDGKVTARHIRSVSEVVKQAMATGAIDGEHGECIPVIGALHAAVTEETYERMKRQQQHLAEKRGERLVAVTPAHVARTYTQEDGDYIVFRVSPEARAALAAGGDYKIVVYECAVLK